MRVLLLTRYGRLGASSRLRFYQYLPYLEGQGARITVAPLLNDDYLRDFYAGKRPSKLYIAGAFATRVVQLLESRRFDLVWVQYEALPWLPAWGEALFLRTPYVVDYDDAVFHRYDKHRNSIVRRLLGNKIDVVMRGAALVTAGNDYIANRAKAAGARRVELLPTVVDLKRYTPGGELCRSAPVIGWMGSLTTTRNLQLVSSALVDVCSDNKARLALVGAGPTQLDGMSVEHRTWAETTEVGDIQRFAIGIMPLYDEPFERGKCGYKLIQYMACGRPVVASPVGVNREIVRHGVNGFLASTPEEWRHYLTILRDDPALRVKMGSAGRTQVEERFALQVTAPKLAALLQSVHKG
jgi:glycosyltransferase involved in cell wall biosynthesis